MTQSIFCRIPFLKFSMLLTFIVFFVGSIPFAHALEIHHLFAEIDHDTHQHSEFDLCQWVKKHTGNSLLWDPPRVSHGSIGIPFLFPESPFVYDSVSCLLSYSRGPPRW
jgi:hypothetical protein